MAATLYMDIMEGSSIEVSPGDIKVTRIALATNIDTTIARALLPRALIVEGLPQWGEVHPEIPSITVQRYMVRSAGDPFSALIEVMYGQADYQGFSTWSVIDDCVVSQEMADKNPVGEQIRAVFHGPPTTGFDFGKPYPFPGYVPRMVTRRTLTVTGLLRRPPGPGVLETVQQNAVNDRLWMGLEKGWWMCTRARVEAHILGKALARENGIQAKGVGITAQFTSRYRNWMEFLIYVGADGKPAQVEAKVARELYEDDYKYAQIEKEKITAIGQYPMVDFRAVFGFGETGQVSPPIGNAWGKQTHIG